MEQKTNKFINALNLIKIKLLFIKNRILTSELAIATKHISNNEKLGKTIYGDNLTMKDMRKRFYFVHSFIKYTIAIPLGGIFYLLFNKRIQKDKLPKNHMNELAVVFDKEFDNAIYDWRYHYLSKNNKTNLFEPASEEYMKKAETSKPNRILRFAKDLILYCLATDTAYMEFFNIFMLRLGSSLSKALPEYPSHLFYCQKTINDPTYFMATSLVHNHELMVKLNKLNNQTNTNNEDKK